MQLTKTEHNKELLEKWKDEEITEEKITGLLNQYLRNYETIISNKTQRVHFENFLKGLLSNLDRKSIESIVLATTDEKGVRPLQQFITRSTFDNETVLNEYQKMLGRVTSSKNGMFSVDGSDFVKKGKKSAGVGRQYSCRYGKIEIRCVSCRTTKSLGNYNHPHIDVWLYIRKYENNDINYFLSNAPDGIDIFVELHDAATLRWPIEQCFEECKSYLGMGHFEGRSYSGFLRHLLFR